MARFLAPPSSPPVRPTSAPDFAVVIPAYQAAAYIGDAIASVLAQTVAPSEIIVCDDGSTDDLGRALEPFRDRITLLEQPNRGEAAAKNAGVAASRAPYVAILDADDVFLPGRLAALGALAAARPDLDLLTTDAHIVVNGRVVRRCFDPSFPFETNDQRRAILRTNFLPFAAFRRAAFVAVGGFDEQLRKVPDWDCWLRMILAGSRAGLIDEPLAEYRLRATNVTSDRLRLHQGRLETLEKALTLGGLTDDEQGIVRAGIERQRREVAIRAARAAVLAGRRDARRLCLDVALTSGVGWSARAKAASAVVSPRLAGWLATRLDDGSVEVAGGMRVRLD